MKTAHKDVTVEPDHIALHAREVKFNWTGLPIQWIPNEAFASHMLNVLHVLLPEGERFFIKVFSDALPLIKDEQLKEDVIGFIGQEGMHANAHQHVQDYFKEVGFDTSPYVRDIEWVFRRLLGDRGLMGFKKEEWLIERLALIAAIEHITAFLGNWILNAPGLDAANADPRMLDLLRWHGAEEVEHRNVAYDTFMHVDGRYIRRTRTAVVAAVAFAYLWAKGVKFLMENDPSATAPQKARFRDLVLSKRKALTPGYLDLLTWTSRYLNPKYHPSSEGSTTQAVAYLAQSPAAMAADGLIAV